MPITIELIDGRWYVCSTGVRVASLGNLSPKANSEEVRFVARETLAGMVNDTAVIREPKPEAS